MSRPASGLSASLAIALGLIFIPGTGSSRASAEDASPTIATVNTTVFANPDGNAKDNEQFFRTDRPGVAAKVSGDAYEAVVPADASEGDILFNVGATGVAIHMVGLDSSPSVEGDQVVYHDVSAADSVVYTATASGLKEDIVLTKPPTAAELSYRYVIETKGGVTPHLTPSGLIEFRDESGDTPFFMPAGTMVDSSESGAGSEDITFGLTAISSTSWQLTVQPDMEWLQDSSREFPVSIDPTVKTNLGIKTDCWLSQSQPDATACKNNATRMQVGRNGLGDRRRGLLFFDLTGIPSTATITSAKVGLFMNSANTINPGSSAEYSLYKAGKSFTESATWNSPGNGSTWTGGSPAGAPLSSKSLTGAGDGYKDFLNLDATFQDWISGTAINRGLVLKQTDETVNTVLSFSSSAAENPDYEWPYAELTFTIDTSAPGWVDLASESPEPEIGSSQLDPSDDATVPPNDTPISEQTILDGTNGPFVEGDDSYAQQAVGPNHNKTLEGKHYRVIDPPGARPANIGAYNKAYVKVPYVEYKADFVHSYARTTWFGRRNVDKIVLSQRWSVSGLNFSVNVPDGVSITDGGKAARKITSRSDTKDVRSDLQQTVHFGGALAVITKVRHAAVGTFVFAGGDYSVESSDSSLV